MGVAISDDGIIIGANIDVSRIQQAASKMKSLMDDFVNSTAKSVQKADQELEKARKNAEKWKICLLYTSPSPRDLSTSRMPSSA